MNVLKSITPFAALPVGVPTALPHGLTDALGAGIVPDHIEASNADITITGADATNVTVTNNGAAPANVDVLCERWYSTDRALPPGQADLPTQPFVPASGSTGGVVSSGAIPDEQIVRGDGGAQGVQGSLPEINDAGDIHPPADGTLDIGTALLRFAAVRASRLIVSDNVAGGASVTSTGLLMAGFSALNQARQVALAGGYGAAVLGYTEVGSPAVGVGTARIQTKASSKGAFASGHTGVYKDFNSLIEAGNRGGHAMGVAYAQYGDASLLASSEGTLVHGSAFGASAGPAKIEATSFGASAGGYAYSGTIKAGAPGSFAFGYSYRAGATATIETGGKGSASFGYAKGAASIGRIDASSHGSFAHGYASGGVYPAVIDAAGTGALVGGHAYSGTITAINPGGFAHGRAGGGYKIQTSGNGNAAMGNASGKDIIAGGNSNSFQFGEGTNGDSDSLQVGDAGIRFKATSGAPAAPQNGDQWVNAGYTYIRSNGVSVKIV